MIRGEDWKDIYGLIEASNSGIYQTINFLIELCKYMQIQINRLEKNNKKIKKRLNKIKKRIYERDNK